jgi:hypothetical protein
LRRIHYKKKAASNSIGGIPKPKIHQTPRQMPIYVLSSPPWSQPEPFSAEAIVENISTLNSVGLSQIKR